MAASKPCIRRGETRTPTTLVRHHRADVRRQLGRQAMEAEVLTEALERAGPKPTWFVQSQPARFPASVVAWTLASPARSHRPG